jgi:hypothetical protein
VRFECVLCAQSDVGASNRLIFDDGTDPDIHLAG